MLPFRESTKLVRQVHQTMLDNEIGKLDKNAYSNIVTPDELFCEATPEYAMAVWTGYSNRFTPVLDNGIQVATDVYRQMMLYLS